MKDNLTQLINLFLHKLTSEKKSLNTLKNYNSDLYNFQKFLLQQKISPKLYLSDEALLEYHRFVYEQNYSDNSKRRKIQSLRLFVDFLITQDLKETNPLLVLGSSPKKLPMPTPVSYDHILLCHGELFQQAFQAQGLDQVISFRNLLLFALIYDGAIPCSQINGIEKRNLLGEPIERLYLRTNKEFARTIPLSPFSSQVAQKYLLLLEEFTLPDESLLFFSSNPYQIRASGLSSRGIEKFFKKLSLKLHIEITPRALRQSGILRWIQSHTPSSTIKEWMGVRPSYELKLYKQFIKENPDCIYSELPLIYFEDSTLDPIK